MFVVSRRWPLYILVALKAYSSSSERARVAWRQHRMHEFCHAVSRRHLIASRATGRDISLALSFVVALPRAPDRLIQPAVSPVSASVACAVRKHRWGPERDSAGPPSAGKPGYYTAYCILPLYQGN